MHIPNELVFTTSPLTNLGFVGNQGTILPFAEVNGGNGTGDFATIGIGAATSAANNGAAANFVGIAAFANYAAQIVAAAGTITAPNANGMDIAKITLTGTPITATGAAYGALLFNMSSAAGIALTFSGAWSVSSGAFMTNGSMTATGNEFTITGSLNLVGETDFFQNIALLTTFTDTKFISAITGTGSLVIAGSGQTQLTAANTYTGGTTVNSANTIFMDTNAAFGTGPLTLRGGTLTSNTTSNSFNNAVTLNGVVFFTSFNTAGAPISFTGPITLTGNSFVSAANGNQTLAGVFFNGAISGAGSLNIVGAPAVATGTTAPGALVPVILNNANTYTGGTIMTAGILQVASTSTLSGNNIVSGPVGTGTLTLAGGALNAQFKLTLPNPVIIPNNTTTISGSSNLTLSGSITLVGSSTLAVTNIGQTNLAGQITGPGALLTAGSSVTSALEITGTTNNYAGGTYITAGDVFIGNASAFGTNTLSLAGGTLLSTGNFALNNALVLNGGTTTFTGGSALTFSGTTTLLAASQLNVNNATPTLSGIIGEAGGVARALTVGAGVGTLTISDPANWFSGGVTLSSSIAGAPVGTLVAGNATGVGTTLGSGALTLTSGIFQVGGNFAVPNAVTFSGTAGSLVIFSGSNPVVFTNSAATPYTLTAALTTTIRADVSTTFNGNFGNTTGALSLLAGNLTLTGANLFTGAVTIGGVTYGTIAEPGILTLSGSNGSLAATAPITISQGGQLVLDNSAANNNARIGGAMTLNGGTLLLKGNGSSATNETIGAITVGAGNAVITLQPGAGGSLTLAGSTMSRASGSGGTVIFGTTTGVGLGTTAARHIQWSAITEGATTIAAGSVIPYAQVNTSQMGLGVLSDFATYTGATNGIESNLQSGGTYTNLSGATSTQNVQLPGSGSLTVSTNQTINALLVSGTSTLIINPGVTLTIAGGGILLTNPTQAGITTLNVEGGGTLALGEGIINTSNTSINTVVNINPLNDGTQILLPQPGS